MSNIFLNFPIKYKPQEKGNYWNIAESVYEENHISTNKEIVLLLIFIIIYILLKGLDYE